MSRCFQNPGSELALTAVAEHDFTGVAPENSFRTGLAT